MPGVVISVAMTDHDLRKRVWTEAEAIAHDRGLDNLEARDDAAGLLRYAALRIIEGHSDVVEPVHEGCRFMVAYGMDKAQYEKWGDEVDWWEDDGPHWAAHRVRIVPRDGGTITPKVARVMEAIGGTFVYHENNQDPNKPPLESGANAYHYIVQDHSEVVADFCDWLRDRHYQQAREEQAGLEA